jgi:ATP-dependent protease ClpP protease subunit
MLFTTKSTPFQTCYLFQSRPGFVIIKIVKKTAFTNIKKHLVTAFMVFLAVSILSSACLADTFTNRKTEEVLHGYATSQTKGSETTIYTKEKGKLSLNLSQWRITPDYLGRNNKVIVLTLDDHIGLHIEAQAMKEAISKSADQGPLFILIEISTPGGQLDRIQQICGQISKTKHCQVIAFITGGRHRGAISGGAAVAFACDKIFMADNTIIGAASLVAKSAFGPKEIKEVIGEELGEKVVSSWRTHLASMAEQHGRPGILAMAMADREIEVIEVSQDSKNLFIDPVNKNPQQDFVHVWSKKGTLLTLTAQDAVKCGIADNVFDSRQQLLRYLKAEDAQIVMNNDLQNSRLELKRAKAQIARIRKSLDLKTQQLDYEYPTRKVLKILQDARSDFQALIRLAKKYPDLQLATYPLEVELNSIEAAYDKIKRTARRRR